MTGSGNRSLDIAVCGRTLGRENLSDVDRASVYTARGRAYRDSGRPAEALADFDAALALNPYSADAFNARALALDRDGQYERALEDFERALALSPRFAAAYKNRAVAYFYAGNLACARADLDAAAAISDTDAKVLVLRGFLHYLAGRYRDAADDFQNAHARALPYPYLPLWRYLAESASDDFARDELIAARATLLADEWPGPLLDAYLGARDPATLMAALEKNDHSPRQRQRAAASHYYIAALERLNGRRERAFMHLTKSVALSERRMPERVLAEHALAHAADERRSTSSNFLSECRR